MTPEQFLAGAPYWPEPVNPWEYTDPAVCPPPLELAIRDRWCDEWAAYAGGHKVRNDYGGPKGHTKYHISGDLWNKR